jgi:hypothetical protein
LEVDDAADTVGPKDSMDSIVAVETIEAVEVDRCVDILQDGTHSVFEGTSVVTTLKTRST